MHIGGFRCYALTFGEKIAYFAALIMAVVAEVLLLYGILMKIFMR